MSRVYPLAHRITVLLFSLVGFFLSYEFYVRGYVDHFLFWFLVSFSAFSSIVVDFLKHLKSVKQVDLK